MQKISTKEMIFGSFFEAIKGFKGYFICAFIPFVFSVAPEEFYDNFYRQDGSSYIFGLEVGVLFISYFFAGLVSYNMVCYVLNVKKIGFWQAITITKEKLHFVWLYFKVNSLLILLLLFFMSLSLLSPETNSEPIPEIEFDFFNLFGLMILCIVLFIFSPIFVIFTRMSMALYGQIDGKNISIWTAWKGTKGHIFRLWWLNYILFLFLFIPAVVLYNYIEEMGVAFYPVFYLFNFFFYIYVTVFLKKLYIYFFDGVDFPPMNTVQSSKSTEKSNQGVSDEMEKVIAEKQDTDTTKAKMAKKTATKKTGTKKPATKKTVKKATAKKTATKKAVAKKAATKKSPVKKSDA